ncbi:phosphate ABC transporter substrate-binding protein [Vibrio azureus]|uniref:Phosphate-binding protein n=1 Tax=Vibrio azureus NBRC 104587 TaxID=1219077 RepID=U3ARC1_9VIBR|nr:phosphate ABC transporter substrate-binding protein [Vibrio azureus]AUI87892.1 phosphate ABC transporter substrate-binding protein [Vibrio azureus]GAD76285.1 putative ABC transporter substrate-binding protein [Vibrio azureus NBRC 104587]
MLRISMTMIIAMVMSLPSAIAKEISISGSTSMAQVIDVLAEHYNQDHPNNFIAVQGIGSSAGIAMVNKGVVELGMSSRYLTQNEKHKDLSVLPIAYDGLAIIVNRANPITSLTEQQIYDIYKGKIKNWQQVGGTNTPIVVVTRETSSGSRHRFEQLLGLTKMVNGSTVSDIDPHNLVVNNTSTVKALISHNVNAVGFVSLGAMDKDVKAVKFNGIAPSTKNIENQKYALARPFLLLYRNKSLDPDSKQFISYLKSDKAQALIASRGYIPNDNMVH